MAQAPSEVAGVNAEEGTPADDVAGVRAAGPAVNLAALLPATGEPLALFGMGLLGLAGIGLFMRRIGRRAR
jgi:hypothetical protein